MKLLSPARSQRDVFIRRSRIYPVSSGHQNFESSLGFVARLIHRSDFFRKITKSHQSLMLILWRIWGCQWGRRCKTGLPFQCIERILNNFISFKTIAFPQLCEPRRVVASWAPAREYLNQPHRLLYHFTIVNSLSFQTVEVESIGSRNHEFELIS